MKIMKRITLILIILQVAITFLLVSCSNSNFLTYEHENPQYSIDYPENWSVETGEDLLATEPPVLLVAPSPQLGRVAIAVIKDNKLSPDQITAGSELIFQRMLQDFTITRKEGKTERWDWSFEGRSKAETNDDVFVFGYYKQRGNYLYKIEGMADSTIWYDSIIDKIVSSFKLL